MAGAIDSEDGDPGFQIAPMVDVVFVLLLFFMAAAGLKMKEKELSISLPGPTGGPSHEIALLIGISPDGQVTLNDSVVGSTKDRGLAALKERLTAIKSFGGNDPVIVRPASQTRHERVVDVLNACSAAGVKKVTFG